MYACMLMCMLMYRDDTWCMCVYIFICIHTRAHTDTDVVFGTDLKSRSMAPGVNRQGEAEPEAPGHYGCFARAHIRMYIHLYIYTHIYIHICIY